MKVAVLFAACLLLAAVPARAGEEPGVEEVLVDASHTCSPKVCVCPTTGLPPCVDVHSAEVLFHHEKCDEHDYYCLKRKAYVRKDKPDEPDEYYSEDGGYTKGGYQAAGTSYGGYHDCDDDCDHYKPEPPKPHPPHWKVYRYKCRYNLLGHKHRCREAKYGCDYDTYCNGTSPVCPPTEVKECGHICRHAEKGNPCDVPEKCDGVSKKCPPQKFAPDGAACSYEPYGLYTAVDDKDGKYGGGDKDKEAKSKGWHKCHKCVSGVCVTYEAKTVTKKVRTHDKDYGEDKDYGKKEYKEYGEKEYTPEFYCH